MEPLLVVEDLRVAFRTEAGRVPAVDGVSFAVRAGETLGLVGESGCGKSATALAILRLLPTPPAEILGGAVRFRGRDLLRASEEELRRVRGREIAMIFQEPAAALNPVLPVGEQIAEVLLAHRLAGRREARERAVELLRRVGIPDPERRARQYPHQLSGGMCQRVMIAMALACRPRLLIADEPTTALDVTVQAQILQLLRDLQQEAGAAILLITHDLGVVADLCDRVAVMYAGRVVESAPVGPLFRRPLHPYTAGLLRCLPDPAAPRRSRLHAIPGGVPDPRRLPPGCRFHPRCPLAGDRCRQADPPLVEVEPGRLTACWHWERLAAQEGAA